MWTDNETEQDFLNFGSVAKTVAEIISQAQSRPISIGVSGAWGVGKSSMIKLIQRELREKSNNTVPSTEVNQYIFVEFNAWLYQDFNLMMDDHSYFQFTESKAEEDVRLAYYPNPYQFVEYENDKREALNMLESNEITQDEYEQLLT